MIVYMRHGFLKASYVTVVFSRFVNQKRIEDMKTVNLI